MHPRHGSSRAHNSRLLLWVAEGTVIHTDLLQGAPAEPPHAGVEEQLPQTALLYPLSTTPPKVGVSVPSALPDEMQHS